jgi:hypothetical protein
VDHKPESKIKMTNLLDENVGNLCNFALGKDYLDTPPKNQIYQRKN